MQAGADAAWHGATSFAGQRCAAWAAVVGVTCAPHCPQLPVATSLPIPSPRRLWPFLPHAVIFTEVIKLLICLVMQFKVIAGEVAGGTAGKPSPPHGGSSSSLGGAHGGGGSAASLFGGAGQAGGQGALAREVRRQARDIAAKSMPMLLPAGMFVMQQVR